MRVFQARNWDFKSFDYDKDVARATQAGRARLDCRQTECTRLSVIGRFLEVQYAVQRTCDLTMRSFSRRAFLSRHCF
jgi:hypothetical protein